LILQPLFKSVKIIKNDGYLYLGVISKLKENKVWNIGNEPGLLFNSICLYLFRSNNAGIGSGNNWSKNFNENNEYNVGDNTVVEVDVDMEKKVIFYFINKKQCPYYISDVYSSPLLFGMGAIQSNSILAVLSIKKMAKSSADSSVPCEAIKWK
jgi:hypothetical protein